jgi:hypothetical protein
VTEDLFIKTYDPAETALFAFNTCLNGSLASVSSDGGNSQGMVRHKEGRTDVVVKMMSFTEPCQSNIGVLDEIRCRLSASKTAGQK